MNLDESLANLWGFLDIRTSKSLPTMKVGDICLYSRNWRRIFRGGVRPEAVQFEKPKNGKGRSLRCSQKATEALRSHRTRQNEERLRVGTMWQDSGLVFPTTTGTTMSGTNLLGRHFKPLLKRAELPAIRLHDLRHTCATILLMAGKHPKYVQELLGHASISITLDTYSHVIEGMDGGLAEAMDDALGGGSGEGYVGSEDTL
jgi:integrase